MYDVKQIREEFPILSREVYGKPLVYLDNGATAQKPRCVIERVAELYRTENANIHRGVHYLSERCTDCSTVLRFSVLSLTSLLVPNAADVLQNAKWTSPA